MPFIVSHIEEIIHAAPDILIPLWQVVLYVLIISFTALHASYRWILISSFVFTSYWVFVENKELISPDYVWLCTAVVFFGFGLLAIIYTVYQMLTRCD